MLTTLKRLTTPIEQALIPLERHPEFAAILAKREALRQRLADCEAEHAQLSASVPSALIYDTQVQRLIDNPALNLEDRDARQRRERLERLEQETTLVKRALEGVGAQLVQMRGRLSAEVIMTQRELCRQDVRRALAAALHLRLVDGQRAARLSRLNGLGYQTGSVSTFSFAQPWGALGDIQSHWATILRELCDSSIISQAERAAIMTGDIPESLERT